ncbi:MAG: imidazole glycerol phosphate synthase subunit HisH [Nitrospinae bacterium]|nr:imidazole glycerol phosphate synthase subunit HisH [Nitrospinota bacterium]MBI3814751.1 imidazole glycerol phosphate synthase subunit HisH [Nitrospinota bacterium]
MIAIIDYRMGNLRSVQKGFEKVGHEAFVTGNPEDILAANGVVLPGVGAFKDCMSNLTEGKLIDPIHKVIKGGKPFLGICLGLQLLFTEGEEFGIHKGLDIIKGRVVRFPEPRTPNPEPLKVPHMGWNSINIRGQGVKGSRGLNPRTLEPSNPLFKDIPDNSYFYFVHSYYVVPEDDSIIASTTDYGVEFVSSISKDNLFAVQFHPEKSQEMGLKILKNFGDMCKT